MPTSLLNCTFEEFTHRPQLASANRKTDLTPTWAINKWKMGHTVVLCEGGITFGLL